MGAEMNLLDVAEAPIAPSLEALLAGNTMCARIARVLMLYRGRWVDGRVLASVGGYAAYRTRISDLRKAPWHLDVRNRYRHVNENGRKFVVSEYCLYG